MKLVLDTRLREDINNLYTNDCTIKLSRRIKAKKIKLLQVVFSNSCFNVNLYNNKFYLTEGGSIVPVQMIQGNYTSQTLISGLKGVLEAMSPNGYTYTCSIDIYTSKLIISSTGPFTLSFDDNSASNVLGFNQSSNPVQNTLQTSDKTPNLLYPAICNFQINANNIESSTQYGNMNYTFCLPLKGDSLQTFFSDANNCLYEQEFPDIVWLDTFHIKLYDFKGRLLLNNESDYILIFDVEE